MFHIHLPEPLLSQIISYWTQGNLCQASLVCKDWYNTCMSHWHTIDLSRSTLHAPGSHVPFNKLPNIKTLDLTACNYLSLHDIKTILEICGRKLEQLLLRRCTHLDDTVLHYICTYCPNLKSVSFASMKKITDEGIIQMMTKNKQIGKIGLANCSRLTDASVIAICQSSQARLTTIGLNSVSNITDISLKHIQEYCTNICILSLSRLTSITSKGMQDLVMTCHQLGSIDLTKCPDMDDETLMAISRNCPSLFQLNVSNTKVTDAGVKAVAVGCPKLRLIFLSSCNVTNDCMHSLAACPLRVLVLNKCRAITAAIFEYLNVRSLKYLDVSGTTIKGNQIPEPFKKIELFV